MLLIYQKTFQADELPSKAHISCFRYSSRDFDYYPIHSHSYYEISFVVSGERYIYHNGKDIKVPQNTLSFVPPLATHGSKNITAVEDMVLQMSTNIFSCISERFDSKMFLALKDDSVPYITLDDDSKLLKILFKLHNLCNRFQENAIEDDKTAVALELKRNSLMLELVAQLIDCGFIIVKTGVSSLSKLRFFDELINRLIVNPQEKIDMAEAARFVGMSYSHFSRLFKELTGTNYAEYCNILRIRHAEELLRNTNMSISQIAFEIGVETPSYFTRLFKSVNGITPAQYRKQQ